MKLSTLMLADHASVREGTLGVLGGYINQLWRSEFPSPLGVYLVAVAETTAEDLEKGNARAVFRFSCESEGNTEAVFEGEGAIESNLEAMVHSHMPMTFDLTNLELPHEGTYNIHFSLDEHTTTYTFYVHRVEPTE